jgi:IS5 family transposase
MKTVGTYRKTRYKGVEKNQMASYFLAAAFNLVRMAKLSPGET